MDGKTPITKEGHKAFLDEISLLEKNLDEKKEEDIVKTYGSFEQAKDRLALLKKIISNVKVMELTTDEIFYIQFGCNILLGDLGTGQELTVQIVGETEADALKGKISVESNLAKVLMGKSIGQAVKINNGKSAKEYEIIEIYR